MKVRKPPLAVLFALVCACLTLLSTSLTYADGPGNSDAAKMCQHGGYLNLMGSDGTLFNNVGECVSYVAQGGTLLPRCGELSLRMTQGGDAASGCQRGCFSWTTFHISGTNFKPDTDLTIVVTLIAAAGQREHVLYARTNSSGSFTGETRVYTYSYMGPSPFAHGSYNITVTQGGCGSISGAY
jgi:hypothetical protein